MFNAFLLLLTKLEINLLMKKKSIFKYLFEIIFERLIFFEIKFIFL